MAVNYFFHTATAMFYDCYPVFWIPFMDVKDIFISVCILLLQELLQAAVIMFDAFPLLIFMKM